MAKSILVTGGAGLIRSHLVDQQQHEEHADAASCFRANDITRKTEPILNHNADIVVVFYQPDDITETYACNAPTQAESCHRHGHLAE